MSTVTRDVPKEIASAIVLVMQAMGRLTKSATNVHGRYKYVSVDDFLAMSGPACSEAGLIVKPVLCAPVERVEVDVYDKDTKQTRKRRMVRYTYKFRLIHSSGATWTDDEDVREVQLDDTGPQTLMAAESYALKGYLRTLLQIPTGDADADAQEQHQAEIIKATVRAHKAKLDTGSEHILIDFGNGIETVAAADVATRVLAHITSIGDAKAVAEWWDSNRHGREQFHNQFPKLALDLKKKVEQFVASLAMPSAAE